MVLLRSASRSFRSHCPTNLWTKIPRSRTASLLALIIGRKDLMPRSLSQVRRTQIFIIDRREICSGSPPEWANRALPYNVQPDMGFHYVDQNSHRMPSANLLPLIVAVNQKQKDEGTSPFPWNSVDFVTDRNGLRKLLRWIIGGEVREFRIDVELVGTKTILFSRWEKRTQEQSSGRTYGFKFEKASTNHALGCEEGSGHHRINSYVRLFYQLNISKTDLSRISMV